MIILGWIALTLIGGALLIAIVAMFAAGFIHPRVTETPAEEFDRLTKPMLRMRFTQDVDGRFIWDGVPIGPKEGFADYCGKLGRGM